MKVLHIDCSVRNEQSLSRKFSASFVHQLRQRFPEELQVIRLDLANDTPPHPTALFTQAMYTPFALQTDQMKAELAGSNALVDKLIEAQVYVVGMPLYNFSVPSNFKAFIDNVVRVGRTFTKTDNGFEGALVNKRMVVISTRGADYTIAPFDKMDHLEPYLRTIFGFMGVTQIEFINVHPVQFFGEEAKQRAITKAHEQITQVANQF